MMLDPGSGRILERSFFFFSRILVEAQNETELDRNDRRNDALSEGGGGVYITNGFWGLFRRPSRAGAFEMERDPFG